MSRCFQPRPSCSPVLSTRGRASCSPSCTHRKHCAQGLRAGHRAAGRPFRKTGSQPGVNVGAGEEARALPSGQSGEGRAGTVLQQQPREALPREHLLPQETSLPQAAPPGISSGATGTPEQVSAGRQQGRVGGTGLGGELTGSALSKTQLLV